MSRINTLAITLGLSVNSVSVAEINPIILKTKVSTSSFGEIVDVDGVPHLVDVAANTAQALTAKAIAEATCTGFSSDKPTKFQTAAINASEACGTIGEIVMVKGNTKASSVNLASWTKANGYKVADVEVATQNAVIFSTIGIKSIAGLTELDNKMYQIDVASNTATVVDAEKLTEKATADFKAGKDTDATRFAESFGLITKLVLGK